VKIDLEEISFVVLTDKADGVKIDKIRCSARSLNRYRY
jgi:hypothetical protein